MQKWPDNPRIAYTAVASDSGNIIGLCHENIDGYSPTSFGKYNTYDEAEKYANKLNAELGLSEKDAILIVLSTMRRKPRKYLIGVINLNDEADDDTVEEVRSILDKANITYDEDGAYIDIDSPMECTTIDFTIFEEIERILQKKGLAYSINVNEFEETGRRYEGGNLD